MILEKLLQSIQACQGLTDTVSCANLKLKIVKSSDEESIHYLYFTENIPVFCFFSKVAENHKG